MPTLDSSLDLAALHRMVAKALEMSDALELDEVGVSLDMARVAVEARLAEADPSPAH